MKFRFKNISKTVIALITVISLCFSVIIVSYANTENEKYGTYEDGVSYDSTYKINYEKPIDTPMNLDFEDGFRYWGTVRVGSANDYADLVKDTVNNNTYVKLTPKQAYDPITTWPFKVSGVKAGDKLSVVYKWKGDPAIQIVLNQYKTNGNVELAKGWAAKTGNTLLKAAANKDDWNISTVPVLTGAGKGSVIDYDPIACFVYVQSWDTAKTSYVDDIEIVKVGTDGKLFKLDGTPYNVAGDGNDSKYGTYEDGVSFENAYKINYEKPVDAPMNFDFEEGFRYWGTVRVGSANDYADLVKDTVNNNTYVKLTPKQAYDPITTWPFKLSGVKAGDKLSVVYKWKGDPAIQIVLNQYKTDGNVELARGSSSVSDYTLLKAAANKDDWNLSTVPVLTGAGKGSIIEYDPIACYIYVQCWDTSKTSYVDDIEVVKVGDDGKIYHIDGTLYDLPTSGGDDGGSEDDKDDVDFDGYGTKKKGIKKELITKTMAPLDSAKNLDFSEGLRYWGTYWGNTTAGDFAEIITENGNSYAHLLPDEKDGSGCWRGPSCVPFYLDSNKIKVGDIISVLYDWKGDAAVQVKLMQVGIDEKDNKHILAGAGPSYNTVIIGETENDWNTSCSYTGGSLGIQEDNTDDGKYAFFIMFQPAGDPSVETYFDNFRIVKVTGEEGSEQIWDLDGNLLKFGNSDSDDAPPVNNDSDSDEDGNTDYDFDYDTDNSSDGFSNNTDNTQSNTENNSYSPINTDTIDVTEAMSQINKLNAGENVDFITLFNMNSQNGGMNAYISVKTLKDDELKAIKAISEEEMKNTTTVLRAILSTLSSKPNMENAKAFAKLGGNPSNTLPLSFTGHIYMPFTANIRIKIASGTINPEKTYYAYHCNPDTRVIDNLGKVYIEDSDDNTYITIRTSSFSDFFISPDNLKPAMTESNSNDTDNSGNIIIWVLIGCGAFIIIAAAALVIIIAVKRKSVKL